jgi:hypothetical protein
MNAPRACEDILANAGLPEDEHRSRGSGDLASVLADRRHLRIGDDQIVVGARWRDRRRHRASVHSRQDDRTAADRYRIAGSESAFGAPQLAPIDERAVAASEILHDDDVAVVPDRCVRT